MKQLLLVLTLLLGQLQTIHAEPSERLHGNGRSWDPNNMIERWGTNKREQETFDSTLTAIKNDLKEGHVNSEKLDRLSGWAERLLAGQNAIKKRAEQLLEDPTVKSELKSDLLNRITLYSERIEQLNKVIDDISDEKKKLASDEVDNEETVPSKLKEIQKELMKTLNDDQIRRQTEELQNLLKSSPHHK